MMEESQVNDELRQSTAENPSPAVSETAAEGCTTTDTRSISPDTPASPDTVPTRDPSISPDDIPTHNPSITPDTVPAHNPSVTPDTIPAHDPSVTPDTIPTQDSPVAPDTASVSDGTVSPARNRPPFALVHGVTGYGSAQEALDPFLTGFNADSI